VSGEFGYLLAFTTGILGAFHCFGMCSGINGGFFAGYSQYPKIFSILGFHGMRILTYSILGIAGAVLGRTVVQVGAFGKMQGMLMIVSGVLVVLIGFYLLFRLYKQNSKQADLGAEQPAEQVIQFINPDSLKAKLAPLLAGLLNGLVPCSLVFSVAIKAAGTADPASAGLLMLVFGLGTLPTMAMVSVTGALISQQKLKLLEIIAALSVIALGIWTVREGWIFYDIMRGLSN